MLRNIFFATAGGLAASALAQAQDAVTIKAQGLGGGPPLVQAIAGAEAVNTRALDEKQSRELAAELEAKRRLVEPGSGPAEKHAAIAKLAKDLESAQQAYEKRLTNIDGAFSINEGSRTLIELSESGGASSKFATRLAAKIITSASARADAEAIGAAVKAAQAQYRDQVQQAVNLAFLQTDQDTRSRWAEKAQGHLSQADVDLALREVLGSNEEFFKQPLLNVLNDEAKAAVRGAQVEILKNAIGYVAGKSAGEIASLRTTMETGFAEQATSLNTISKQVHGFGVLLNQNTEAIKQLAQHAADQAKAVQTIQQQVTKVDAQVGAIQSAMWRTMSPREQLAALDDDGFFPSLKGADRKDLREGLQKTVTILNYRDNTQMALQGIGGVAAFAKAVGLPIDTYNLNRNLVMAESAVNVVASLAMGNYFAAFSAAGGLFSGGGGDPSAAQFAQVNAKLDRIIDLQYKTLEAIENLSAQLSNSTYSILTKLDDVEARIELVATADLAKWQTDSVNKCKHFVNNARDYNMRGGLFPTYEDRVKHFVDQQQYPSYKLCVTFLDEEATVVYGKAQDAARGQVNPLLLAKFNHPANPVGPGSYQYRYQSVHSYSRHLWGITDEGPACAARALAKLAVAPMLHSLVDATSLRCVSNVATEQDAELRTSRGAPVDAVSALADALAPGPVRIVGEYVSFFTPYQDLVRKDTTGTVVGLRPLSAFNAAPMSTAPETKRWTNGYIDVLNLTLAQSAILSGAFIADQIAEVLAAHKFGTAGSVAWMPAPAANDAAAQAAYSNVVTRCDSRDDPGRFKALPYVFASCFAAGDAFPTIRANVLHRLVKHTLAKSKATIPEYAWALRVSNPELMAGLLPGVPLRYVADGASKGWHLVFKGPDRVERLQPLPPASEIATNAVVYSLSTDGLREMRQRLLERAALLELAAPPGAGEFYLRQSLLNDPSFVSVSFTPAN